MFVVIEAVAMPPDENGEAVATMVQQQIHFQELQQI